MLDIRDMYGYWQHTLEGHLEKQQADCQAPSTRPSLQDANHRSVSALASSV